VDGDGDLTKLVFVLAGVVGAEQQLSAIGQLSAYVCLSTTTVATIGGVEGSRWSNSSRHV